MRSTEINKNHENPFAFSQMNAAHCIDAKSATSATVFFYENSRMSGVTGGSD